MSELQWLDQPTEEGWWWYYDGYAVKPLHVIVADASGRLRCPCRAKYTEQMTGKWKRMVAPAPPHPAPQPEIVDCQMVRVKYRRNGQWGHACALRGRHVLIVWDNGAFFTYTDSEFRSNFHLPPGFEWPEKMLRL